MQGDDSAKHGTENEYQVRQVAVYRHHYICMLVGVIGTGTERLVQFGKAFDGLLLMTEGLYHLLTGKHLLHIAVHGTQVMLLVLEIKGGTFTQLPGGKHHHTGHDQHQDGERQRQHYHTCEGGNDGDERGEHRWQTAAYHLTQRVHIVGIYRHDVAMRMLVEISYRQLLHMLEQTFPQPQQGALTNVYHQTVIQV